MQPSTQANGSSRNELIGVLQLKNIWRERVWANWYFKRGSIMLGFELAIPDYFKRKNIEYH